MKSVHDIVFGGNYQAEKLLQNGIIEYTWKYSEVKQMLKEYALEIIDEIVENRDLYFYTKMGTEDINIEDDILYHLKQKIEDQ